MKDPLLRHNAEDDEMRFSGLHKQKDSRSKAFMRLNKMTDGCDAIAPTPTNNTGTVPLVYYYNYINYSKFNKL